MTELRELLRDRMLAGTSARCAPSYIDDLVRWRWEEAQQDEEPSSRPRPKLGENDINLLTYLCLLHEEGLPTPFIELAEECGFRTVQMAALRLYDLQRRGFVRREVRDDGAHLVPARFFSRRMRGYREDPTHTFPCV